MSTAVLIPPPPATSRRRAPAAVLFTVGYEKSAPEAFLDRLKGRGVTLLADVRDFPGSRRKGFSKRALQAILEAEGIEYLHLKSLGAPKDLRDALRGGGAWADYARAYTSRVLDRQAESLRHLARLARTHRVALLCYERDPLVCHRSLVAARLMRSSPEGTLSVEHIRY